MNTILTLALALIMSGPVDTSPKTEAPCNTQRGWVMPEDGAGCVYAPRYYSDEMTGTVHIYGVLYVQVKN